MFCPECGRPLPDANTAFCPHCGNRVEIPIQPVRIPVTAQTETAAPKRSRLCTAALLLGVGTFVFGMLTLTCKLTQGIAFRMMAIVAVITFFFAPLACCFGVAGIISRARSRKKGLPSAIIGLILGLVFGLVAAICLLARVLGL